MVSEMILKINCGTGPVPEVAGGLADIPCSVPCAQGAQAS